MIIWQGPSVIDGAPIVLIASGLETDSPNSKTGAMVQTYILRSDMNPLLASKTGADVSICGSCPHRGKLLNGTLVGRSCYVTLIHGPRVVFDAFERGAYPHATLLEAQKAFAGRRVRMGAYGDPAAIPFRVWACILLFAEKVTGYTHQWRVCDPQFANFVMASCDSESDEIDCNAMGYRAFRVRPMGAPMLPREVMCPASAEAGHKTTCFDCSACGGHDSKARANITIMAHGAGARHIQIAA
jgi:hypothetical protein